MYCKKCGEEIAEDVVFCPKCGQKQVEESPKTAKEVSENNDITTKEAVSGGSLGVIQFIVAIVLIVVGFSALLSTCS